MLPHLLIHFPNTCNGRCLAELELEAENSIQVSHVVSGAQLFGPSLLSPKVCVGRKVASGARARNQI